MHSYIPKMIIKKIIFACSQKSEHHDLYRKQFERISILFDWQELIIHISEQ